MTIKFVNLNLYYFHIIDQNGCRHFWDYINLHLNKNKNTGKFSKLKAKILLGISLYLTKFNALKKMSKILKRISRSDG